MTYHDIDMEYSPTWLCDNDALVKIYKIYNETSSHDQQVNLFQDIAEDYMTSTKGRCTLLPEWDILSELLRTQKTLGLKVEWIRSHQDNKTSFNKLDFKVQLYVLADKEASDQHQQFHASLQLNKVPKLPWVPVQLLHKNTTITT